jgi:hypothetical protein
LFLLKHKEKFREKLIKIGVAVLILAMTLSLCSCDVTELTKTVLGEVGGVLEDLMFRADYNFSDIRLTQKGINKFEISFIADSGNDDVEIYLSNSFSKIGNAEAEKVTKTPIGDDLVHFSFTKELDLAEDKYLWISCGDKATVASFTVPSAFPTVTLEGGKTVHAKANIGQIPVYLNNSSGDAAELKPIFDGINWYNIKHWN